MDNDAETIMREIASAIRSVPPNQRPWHERIVLGCWAVSAPYPPLPAFSLLFPLRISNMHSKSFMYCYPFVDQGYKRTKLSLPNYPGRISSALQHISTHL